MDEIVKFEKYVLNNLIEIGKDHDLLNLSNLWIQHSIQRHYSHNFSWLGRPVIQIPQDIYAIQEIIWKVRPSLIIETGIAHGGSLILSASILALLNYTDAVNSGSALAPSESKRRVVGIDIEIRPHNRKAIECHPLSHLIEMIEGSSVHRSVIDQVHSITKPSDQVLVFLDSNHTHDHVLQELEAYAPLVSPESYIVVWDTGIEDLPDGFIVDRPWGKGNNPKTAVWEYMRRLTEEGRKAADGGPLSFEIDKKMDYKLVVTASTDGFLRRVT